MQNFPEINLKRHTILWVLAAVLLSYAGLFLHQVEHQLSGDDADCVQCLAANHFGNAMVADIPTIPVVRHSHLASQHIFVLFDVVHFSYFAARAPPPISLV